MTAQANRTYDDVLSFIKLSVSRIVADRTSGEAQAIFNAIGPDTELLGGDALDLDSLDALDLISTVEKQYAVTLPADIDMSTLRTVGDLVVLTQTALSEVRASA